MSKNSDLAILLFKDPLDPTANVDVKMEKLYNVRTLGDLFDTTISNPQDGQFLMWNQSLGGWENSTGPALNLSAFANSSYLSDKMEDILDLPSLITEDGSERIIGETEFKDYEYLNLSIDHQFQAYPRILPVLDSASICMNLPKGYWDSTGFQRTPEEHLGFPDGTFPQSKTELNGDTLALTYWKNIFDLRHWQRRFIPIDNTFFKIKTGDLINVNHEYFNNELVIPEAYDNKGLFTEVNYLGKTTDITTLKFGDFNTLGDPFEGTPYANYFKVYTQYVTWDVGNYLLNEYQKGIDKNIVKYQPGDTFYIIQHGKMPTANTSGGTEHHLNSYRFNYRDGLRTYREKFTGHEQFLISPVGILHENGDNLICDDPLEEFNEFGTLISSETQYIKEDTILGSILHGSGWITIANLETPILNGVKSVYLPSITNVTDGGTLGTSRNNRLGNYDSTLYFDNPRLGYNVAVGTRNYHDLVSTTSGLGTGATFDVKIQDLPKSVLKNINMDTQPPSAWGDTSGAWGGSEVSHDMDSEGWSDDLYLEYPIKSTSGVLQGMTGDWGQNNVEYYENGESTSSIPWANVVDWNYESSWKAQQIVHGMVTRQEGRPGALEIFGYTIKHGDQILEQWFPDYARCMGPRDQVLPPGAYATSNPSFYNDTSLPNTDGYPGTDIVGPRDFPVDGLANPADLDELEAIWNFGSQEETYPHVKYIRFNNNDSGSNNGSEETNGPDFSTYTQETPKNYMHGESGQSWAPIIDTSKNLFIKHEVRFCLEHLSGNPENYPNLGLVRSSLSIGSEVIGILTEDGDNLVYDDNGGYRVLQDSQASTYQTKYPNSGNGIISEDGDNLISEDYDLYEYEIDGMGNGQTWQFEGSDGTKSGPILYHPFKIVSKFFSRREYPLANQTQGYHQLTYGTAWQGDMSGNTWTLHPETEALQPNVVGPEGGGNPLAQRDWNWPGLFDWHSGHVLMARWKVRRRKATVTSPVPLENNQDHASIAVSIKPVSPGENYQPGDFIKIEHDEWEDDLIFPVNEVFNSDISFNVTDSQGEIHSQAFSPTLSWDSHGFGPGVTRGFPSWHSFSDTSEIKSDVFHFRPTESEGFPDGVLMNSMVLKSHYEHPDINTMQLDSKRVQLIHKDNLIEVDPPATNFVIVPNDNDQWDTFGELSEMFTGNPANTHFAATDNIVLETHGYFDETNTSGSRTANNLWLTGDTWINSRKLSDFKSLYAFPATDTWSTTYEYNVETGRMLAPGLRQSEEREETIQHYGYVENQAGYNRLENYPHHIQKPWLKTTPSYDFFSHESDLNIFSWLDPLVELPYGVNYSVGIDPNSAGPQINPYTGEEDVYKMYIPSMPSHQVRYSYGSGNYIGAPINNFLFVRATYGAKSPEEIIAGGHFFRDTWGLYLEHYETTSNFPIYNNLDELGRDNSEQIRNANGDIIFQKTRPPWENIIVTSQKEEMILLENGNTGWTTLNGKISLHDHKWTTGYNEEFDRTGIHYDDPQIQGKTILTWSGNDIPFGNRDLQNNMIYDPTNDIQKVNPSLQIGDYIRFKGLEGGSTGIRKLVDIVDLVLPFHTSEQITKGYVLETSGLGTWTDYSASIIDIAKVIKMETQQLHSDYFTFLGRQTTKTFIADGNQAVFDIEHIAGNVDVWVNGIYQTPEMPYSHRTVDFKITPNDKRVITIWNKHDEWGTTSKIFMDKAGNNSNTSYAYGTADMWNSNPIEGMTLPKYSDSTRGGYANTTSAGRASNFNLDFFFHNDKKVPFSHDLDFKPLMTAQLESLPYGEYDYSSTSNEELGRIMTDNQVQGIPAFSFRFNSWTSYNNSFRPKEGIGNLQADTENWNEFHPWTQFHPQTSNQSPIYRIVGPIPSQVETPSYYFFEADGDNSLKRIPIYLAGQPISFSTGVDYIVDQVWYSIPSYRHLLRGFEYQPEYFDHAGEGGHNGEYVIAKKIAFAHPPPAGAVVKIRVY